MTWIQRLQSLTRDQVRLVQLFMLCRQSGVIISSIVIARSLPVAEVGVFEMLMLCGYLMTFFWSDALLKGYLATPQINQDEATASSFIWFYLLAGMTGMAILVMGQDFLLPFFVDRPTLQGLPLFALYQALVIPVWIAPFLGILKKQNALLISVYVLIGPSFACWAGLRSIPDLTGILIGLISYALVGLIWVLVNTGFVRDMQVKKLVVSLWPATWPLVMYAVSAGLARSFDAWLVAHRFDEASFAIFRYGAREFPLVMALAAGLSTIMIPKLRFVQALEELESRSTRLMHLCFPIVSVIMLLSPFLFAFFFGAAYRESALIFNIYLLVTLTQLLFPQSVMTARGDTRLLWYVSIAELLVNVVASIILLSYFGLAGIAWGTLIAFAFEKAVLMVLVRKRYGIQPGQLVNVPVWLIYLLVLSISFVASQWISGL